MFHFILSKIVARELVRAGSRWSTSARAVKPRDEKAPLHQTPPRRIALLFALNLEPGVLRLLGQRWVAGENSGNTNFYRRNRAVPVLVRMLGFDVIRWKTEVITKSTSAYFSHYMIEKGGISVKRA